MFFATCNSCISYVGGWFYGRDDLTHGIVQYFCHGGHIRGCAHSVGIIALMVPVKLILVMEVRLWIFPISRWTRPVY